MENTPKREMIGAKGHVLLDTMRRLHRKKAVDSCIKLVKKNHPADLAWVFRYLSDAEQRDFFQIITQTERVADFLSELDASIMVELVDELSPRFLAKVVGNMAADDAADLLEALPDEVAAEIQTHMEAVDRHKVEELLKYHPATAGGLMSPDFMYLDEEFTVEEAIKKIQKRSADKEMVFYLYITHGDGQLTGVLSLRELILQPMHRQLKNIMNTTVISVTTDTDQEEVAHVVSQYNLLALPVVDATFKLVGIITVDDVIDVMRGGATKDFLRMAGAGKDHAILLKSTLRNVFIRAPWLAASLVGGIAAMFIITSFKGELMKTLALASFIPVVIGMGGNIATQSATLIVRGLATGRINMEEFFRVIFKEFKVGLILGATYGLLLGIITGLGYSEPARLGLVAGISVFLVMAMAATVGAFVPLLLKRFDIDAAIATGPFVTTAIDIIGVYMFFMVARLLFGL